MPQGVRVRVPLRAPTWGVGWAAVAAGRARFACMVASTRMTAVDPALDGGPQAGVLGPFVLERVIGSGGMGEVWRALHREERVPVAIKVIGQHWARQPSYRAAFQREVRAVAGLLPLQVILIPHWSICCSAAMRRPTAVRFSITRQAMCTARSPTRRSPETTPGQIPIQRPIP